MFKWLKRQMPKSLYGRAALILLLPVVTIQLAVGLIFIQRHYEDVTRQMTDTMVPVLRAQDPVLDRALGIEEGRAPAPDGNRRSWYDFSGRIITEQLFIDMPDLLAVDLASDLSVAQLWLGGRHIRVPRDRLSAANPHQVLVMMVFVSLLMTLVAYLFLRNQLRSVKRMADAAEGFGRGRAVAFRPSGASEVRAAGAAFLDMRARIERHLEQRTLMLSGVSHDLRTPLTRMKLALAMEDGEEVEALRGDVAQMERMIDSFLDFARGATTETPEPVDLRSLVEEVIAQAERARRDVTLGDVTLGDGQAMLRRDGMLRALSNLLANGVHHGTRARLSVAQSERALRFTVEDDGPGIPEADRAEALKPFARLDAARGADGGVGLGLAIATDLARQHGGTLRLGESADLGGLRVDLVLPR